MGNINMVRAQDQAPVACDAVEPATCEVLRFRGDAAYAGPVIPLADFGVDSNAAAVHVVAGEDVRTLVPHLAQLRLIEVGFAKYRDGRGYSTARILREAGYTGELRAAGDVLVDQLAFMRRVGFDSFAPAKPLNPADVDAALTRYAFVYQKAADAGVPVWALRHG
jgi:uncharacterized protein (DUF934 family)